MTQVISTETRELMVNEHNVYVSVITFNELMPDKPDAINEEIQTAYMELARELLSKPDVDTQKSACLITNLTPIEDQLTKKAIEAWYETATEDSFQTQHALYQLFQRPAFSIVTLPGIEEDYVRKQERKISPNANPTHVVNNFEEAMKLAQTLMGAAHR